MDFKDLSPMLIPILAMLIPIVAIIGGVVIKALRMQLIHETVRELSERGQPIPPELLVGKQVGGSGLSVGQKSAGTWNGAGLLRGGAISIGVGMAVSIMFFVMDSQSWQWAIGLIPLFVGIALLVIWKVERPAS